jgi:hypothetical protein
VLIDADDIRDGVALINLAPAPTAAAPDEAFNYLATCS